MEGEEILSEEQRRHAALFKHLFEGLYVHIFICILYIHCHIALRSTDEWWLHSTTGIWFPSNQCIIGMGYDISVFVFDTLPRKDLDMFNFQLAKQLKQKNIITLVGNTSTYGAYCIPLQSQIDNFLFKQACSHPLQCHHPQRNTAFLGAVDPIYIRPIRQNFWDSSTINLHHTSCSVDSHVEWHNPQKFPAFRPFHRPHVWPRWCNSHVEVESQESWCKPWRCLRNTGEQEGPSQEGKVCFLWIMITTHGTIWGTNTKTNMAHVVFLS